MKPRPSRPLTLIDLMILIAATAVALACDRAIVENMRETIQFTSPVSPHVFRFKWIVFGFQRYCPFLATWSVALTVIRLRRPGLAQRRLSRQPGFVACGIVTVALIFITVGLSAGYAIGMLASVFREPAVDIERSILLINRQIGDVGIAVAAAWAVLAVGRRCQAERSWIDRAGRLLGVCWIVVSFLRLVDWPLP